MTEPLGAAEDSVTAITSDFFSKKKKKHDKKKRSGFNASVVASELETNDIVCKIVEKLSASALKRLIADSAGCPRRMTALTFLRDFAFAYGTETADFWPEVDKFLIDYLDIICVGRDDIVPKPRVKAMVACWKEWGALSSSSWDLIRVEEILSLVRFSLPDETELADEGANFNATDKLPVGLEPNTPFRTNFVRCIPKIVEAVAFAGKSGIHARAILKEARVTPVSENPGPLLRLIPELVCRREGKQPLYYLSNEDGYREPILVSYLSFGGGGVDALRILASMALLFGERNVSTWPYKLKLVQFAMRFCGCDFPEQPKVIECWKRLGVMSRRSKSSMEWNRQRIEEVLSSSLVVTLNLDQCAQISLLRNFPLLDETSVYELQELSASIPSS